MSQRFTTLLAGSPQPLGSHFDGQGVNFALYSQHAQRIELCLFDRHGEEQRLELTSRTNHIWHGYVPGMQPGQHYGYRVYGPWDPKRGLRFNPQKLAIDPYCLAVSGKVGDDPLLYDSGSKPDPADSAPVAPKSIVVSETYDWQGDVSPNTPWSKTVIYEAHVRGLTKAHPDIPEPIRGTYAALAHPVMLDYLQKLGITAIELLPIQVHLDEPRLLRNNLTNYWGYNTLAAFAIEPEYWSGRPGTTALSEFRDAVKALHRIGIEVILDIELNHTAELDLNGPTLSFRSIDNPNYYWLNENGNYHNWTGCGNTIRLAHPAAQRWVLDCLRFWVDECHVDGFRFDLATVLGRTPEFDADSPLFQAMMNDPVLSKVKLIAEPWDIGPNGYQLGHYPPPFAEWSDRFRDAMRRFWLIGDAPLSKFARRFAASSDLFDPNRRLPFATVNVITTHDGFTLRDLVSFAHKHNDINGEHNRDGHNHNYSHNHGMEGLHANEQTQLRRLTSQRSLLSSLFLSLGTPMLLSGDEQGKSQQGNNNAYCQDSPLTWLHWATADNDLIAFTQGLIALRQTIPALTAGRWWTGEITPEKNVKDVEWLNGEGASMIPSQWESSEPQALQILMSGEWLIVVNPCDSQQTLNLPTGSWTTAPPFSRREIYTGETQCIAEPRTISVLKKQQQHV